MRTLYIIKAGTTFPRIRVQQQDFEDWIRQGLQLSPLPAAPCPAVAVIDATRPELGSLPYPAIESCAGVVISGSHAMVTEDADWMQNLAQWLHSVCMAGVPMLGICFGHQLLAQVLGGQVGEHPGGLEMGTVPVSIQADVSHDPLWRDMPPCFEAHTVHYQSVRRLPAGACAIAGNSHEPHHAFRWRHNAWGVQFHPEFSRAAMQGYIDHISQELAQQGALNLPLHHLRCHDTPEAARLLQAFALHVQQWASSTQCLPAQTYKHAA